MSDNSIDPVEFMRVMKRTRLRRRFFFATVLAYLPALWVTHAISPTDRAMGTLFGIWVIFLVVSTFMVALCKCPHCGNYFHLHGVSLLVLRKCLHCQLHITSDADKELNC